MAIVGELAFGVISNFLTEGLKRPLNGLTREIGRRDQVGRVLNDRPPLRMTKHNDQVEKILNDLGRLIGNREGKLTEAVAEFLRELQRTAIPEAVANAALCGADREPIFKAFNIFYKRFDRLPFGSRQLFDGLYEASLARIENVKDDALLDIIRAQHSVLSAQLDVVIRSLSSNLSAHNKMTFVDLQEARLKVAKGIEIASRYVSVETLQGSRKYKLKSLFIPSRLTELEETHIQAAKVPLNNGNITYINFRRNFDRAVILGDPGGGKSTLAQLISYDLANLIGIEASHPGRKEFDARDLKIPLRIVLRSLESKQNKIPSYTLFDYIRDEIKVYLDNSDELANRFLNNILSTGEGLIIFDGLDEVLDVGARRDMVAGIENFAGIYAACPILVTSRLVGYRDAPLNEEFTAYGLARFNLDEIKKYSEKSIMSIKCVKLSEARERAEEFTSQTKKVGADIRENPLMLGLMVQIFVYRGDVPSQKPEVYKECATLMFEKWDGRRAIVAEVPRQDVELLDVFGYVASRTFGDVDHEEGVSKEWLTSELKQHFEKWYVDRASAHRAATSLVDFLTGRAWVMSEVGQDTFKFTHRTLLEYFFARNLISESRGIDELITKKLLPRIIDNQWVVISHLALHMAIFRDGGKAKQASEAIISILEKHKLPAKQELSLMEFISTALDYIIIPESSYVKILHLLIERAVILGSSENLAAAAIVSSVIQTSNHRQELAVKAITSVLERGLSDPNGPEFLFSMYLMGSRPPQMPFNPRYYRANITFNTLWTVLEDFRRLKRNYLLNHARKTWQIAKAFAYVYDGERNNLYQLHKANFFKSLPTDLTPIGVEQLLTIPLTVTAFTLREKELGYFGHLDIADCESFVISVARDVIIDNISSSGIISINPAKSELIERDIDFAFRGIWNLPASLRRNANLRNKASAILVCIFRIQDQMPQQTKRADTHHSRLYSGLFAPLEILARVVTQLAPSEFHAWLNKWLDAHRTQLELQSSQDRNQDDLEF